MPVYIGHASIDENKKARGGASGDQTGKEVCIRTWYSKPWEYILRPKDEALANESASCCEWLCRSNLVGYDQNERNTLHNELKKLDYIYEKLTTKCETDCSAFVTVCAIAGGCKELEYTGNAPTTWTLAKDFNRSGKYIIMADKKYLVTDTYLKRGDILVKPGSHTVMVL